MCMKPRHGVWHLVCAPTGKDAFELWCWRRLFRVPWIARRSSQPILKDISPECSLEGLMLKLKLQYFGHLMRTAGSFEKILMLGKIEGRRRRGWQRMRWLNGSPTQWTWVWVNSGVGDGQGGLVCCSPWGRKESDMTEWTELNWSAPNCSLFFIIGIGFIKTWGEECGFTIKTIGIYWSSSEWKMGMGGNVFMFDFLE